LIEKTGCLQADTNGRRARDVSLNRTGHFPI